MDSKNFFVCSLVWKRVCMENYMFWSEIGSAFGEPGAAHPTKNSQGYPPGINVKTIGLSAVSFLTVNMRGQFFYPSVFLQQTREE